MSKRNGSVVGRVSVSCAVALALMAGVPAWGVEKAAPPAAGTKKPVAAPVDPKALAALKPAIDALAKEAKDAKMVEGKLTGLRDKSDYFGEKNKLPEAVTAEVLLAQLEQTVNPSPTVEAYVKWQLMSGLPDQLSDEQAQRVYAIYKRAPEPVANPGLRRTELQSALYKAGAMNPKNDVAINREFDAAMDQFTAANDPIISYRNALYSRLPSGYQTLVAGLEDLFARVGKGLEVKAFWERVEQSVRVWSATAEGPQLNQMASALGKLQAMNKDPRYKPYTHVIQNPDKNKMGLVWDDRQAINEQYLTDLIAVLKDASRGAPMGAASGGAAMKK